MQLFKSLFSKPLSKTLTVSSSNGFHLRPVAQFATLAKSFKNPIVLQFNNKQADAKKVNEILSLSLEQHDAFTLTIKGKHAEQSLEKLVTLFNQLMQDDIEVKKIQKTSSHYEGNAIEGDIIAKGIAVAQAVSYQVEAIKTETSITFTEALDTTVNALNTQYEENKTNNNAQIYLAQKELLLSLAEKSNTLDDLEKYIQNEIETLKDSSLSTKISDYKDILHQVKHTLGFQEKLIFPDSPFILLASDLLPSEITLLSQSNIAGVILKETAINSHTSILLRASGIPSLVADTNKVPLDKTIILDSFAGLVITTPTLEDKEKALTLQEQTIKDKAYSASKRFEKAITSSGKVIDVYANVGDPESAKLAKEEGAEGIGLLRSEFLFKSLKPTLTQQTDAYKEIFTHFDDITVRTLDVGGDKALPYINIPLETNPFLGLRGVRLFRTHPQILEEQLHAIFLAASGKKIKIMFPMVATLEEFTKAKDFANNVALKHQIDISNIEFGIMIEVPSVLFLIPSFNEVVDFYSIGTNDLTQYLFCIERTHPLLKADELSPVVFSAIESIVTQSTKPVSICGELAANADAIEKLIHIGLQRLSVSPKSIAQIKEQLRHV